MTFEWDEEKAIFNLKKHGISFEEAKSLFNDPILLTFADEEHSNTEQRFISIGLSSKGNVLVLIHTERRSNLRIISCRKATKKERSIYEKRAL